MTMRWYVVHTFSGFEKRVARSLEEHIKNTGMQHLFGEILVPTEEIVELKKWFIRDFGTEITKINREATPPPKTP